MKEIALHLDTPNDVGFVLAVIVGSWATDNFEQEQREMVYGAFMNALFPLLSEVGRVAFENGLSRYAALLEERNAKPHNSSRLFRPDDFN